MRNDEQPQYYYYAEPSTDIHQPNTKGGIFMNGSISSNTINTAAFVPPPSAEQQLAAAKDRIKAEKKRKKEQKAREDEAKRLEAMKLSLQVADRGEPGDRIVDRAKKIQAFVEEGK